MLPSLYSVGSLLLFSSCCLQSPSPPQCKAAIVLVHRRPRTRQVSLSSALLRLIAAFHRVVNHLRPVWVSWWAVGPLLLAARLSTIGYSPTARSSIPIPCHVHLAILMNN